MRVDIMTDIETLGKGDKTTVFQVAACMFNIETGEIIDTFNQTIDISKDKSIPVDGDTLLWWLNTDKELLTKLLNSGTVSQKDLFDNFRVWIMQFSMSIKDVFLWGNGMLFDNKLIQSKMQEYDIEYPIFYRNDRDMRTIVELAALKSEVNTEKEFRELNKCEGLTLHDGLDDVKAQIYVLSKAWNILLK